MSEKVVTAVLNNIVWCAMVCETHGISSTLKKHIWKTTSKAPTFYPDMITSNGCATVDEVIENIGNNDISSIKDSFASLDMSPLDFEMLFTAEWIYHEPVANLEPVKRGWCHVTTEKDLADWASFHLSENVIRPELLGRPDVKIYLSRKIGDVAGFLANLGADAVGISNVFSSVNCNNVWSDILQIVAFDFPGLPMVGYQRGDGLTAALQSGWTSVGPLNVWVRSKD
ncbi:hypothetical protein [Paenibacillus sp. NFR01]|uniref:hypothetical protein n=1 Tax=Paenibacillus sp. NFR01 TaxID=1566279 RepID=UPI0008AF56A5|nr:hypothetical protein [Paenibacillus sp. NFR01]SET03532.1 hypothetical protein SAMN03159358_0570 [Paenibacillus sp. NFR01]